MKGYFLIVPMLGVAISLAVTGCRESATNHKLIGTGGKHSVPLYRDEATYEKTSHQPAGADTNAQQVDDQTPVVIITADDTGAVVHIIDGPMRGQSGFVTKDNVE